MTFNDLSISESAIETTGVQSQPDTLTGTAAENKLVFDALPQLIVARFNMLITQLQAQAAAEQLGVTPFTGMTATNLQDALEALQTNLTQAIAGVGTGLAGSSGAASVGFNSTEQITAATVQAAIEAVQQHLDAFKTQMTGSGGAASVGTAPISGLDATNVQAALAELRDDIQNIVSGIIPGGTITTNMLADGSVTAAKLNVTGEDIPTSTTDATSLSSQLSNKVACAGEPVPLGTNILTLAPGRYSVDQVPNTEMANKMNLPVTAWHCEIDVIAAINATGLVSNYKVIIVYPRLDVVLPYINIMNYEGNWTGWTLISTATPPEEYDIPFRSGWQANGMKATYCKSQEGICIVNCAAYGTGTASDNFIATLPEGFHPSGTICCAAHTYKDGVRGIAEAQINAYGDIVIYSPIEFDYVSFSCAFVAGN